MKQSLGTRLKRIEATHWQRATVARDKLGTDNRVRSALASLPMETALEGLPAGYAGMRARTVIEAAFRADQ